MEYPPRTPLYVTDYSSYYGGCDYCGRILTQVRDTQPLPCMICSVTHYCSTPCLVSHLRSGHKLQCAASLDADIDIQGALITTRNQALWDLRKYTHRWHDELGDAAIAAMNLHADPTAMERTALISATSEPFASFTGSCLDAALIRRHQNSIVNRRNGMVGCALIVLACEVPGVGAVYNSTFIGPEASILADPPPVDWHNRLWLAVRKNEIS